MWAASTGWCGDRGSGLGFIRGQAAKVVVDLGKRSSGAGEQAAEFNPEILILTHSDDDHIGGFQALAKQWPSRLSEVWVPYEWGLLAEALAALLGWEPPHPQEEVQPDQIRTLGVSDEGRVGLPAAVMTDGEGDDEMLGSLIDFIWGRDCGLLQGDVSGVVDSYELEIAITAVIEHEREANPSWPPVPKPEKARRVSRDVVKKAEAILGILATATSHRTRVRYFSTDAVRYDRPDPWTTEGTPGIATVVNAVEVRRIPARFREPARAMYLAYELTVQNRRALAAFLWERSCICGMEQICGRWGWERAADIPMEIRDAHGVRNQHVKPWGVLIWSDGAGESCGVGRGARNDLVPWEHVTTMTAPHHGSRGIAHRWIWAALAEAEEVLGRRIPVLLAGGTGSQGTAAEYLAVERERRACTRCRHLGDSTSKTVVLAVDGPTVTMSPACRD